jgi:hypothetical protein
MPSIGPFLAKADAFQPEAVDAMSKAFVEVCVGLRISRKESHEREVVAEMIIDLARTGVRDANDLRDQAIQKF